MGNGWMMKAVNSHYQFSFINWQIQLCSHTYEIKENDYNLNIPRYVNTFEEEAEVDINKVQSEIDTFEKDLSIVQTQMKKYLEELNGWS